MITITITDSGPSPRSIDAVTNVPDRNAPVVTPCYIYLVALERCDSRSEYEMIMGPPSVNAFMARIEDLVEISILFSSMEQGQQHHLCVSVRSSTEKETVTNS